MTYERGLLNVYSLRFIYVTLGRTCFILIFVKI